MAGTYRGQLVALKRYTRRHLDLTRQMKKEMKMVITKIFVGENVHEVDKRMWFDNEIRGDQNRPNIKWLLMKVLIFFF